MRALCLAVVTSFALGFAMPHGMAADTLAASGMEPPWHQNVRGPACGMDGCRTCGPTMPCGPSCDPCCEPVVESYRLPPLFPRLHALCCGGYLLSPTPPKLPRCPQCGCPISDGF